MKKVFNKILKYIKKYDVIAIARHSNSDLDCLGSQFALKEWINLNFPNKKVYCLGENHSYYSKNFIPKCDDIDKIEEDFLGIVVDVNMHSRIANKELLLQAKEKICIDHHHYDTIDYDYYYIEENRMSCAELIAEILMSTKKYKLNQNICKYLYAGIVSDSGDFYYDACSYKTFLIASKLIKIGNFNVYHDVNVVTRQRSYEELKLISLISNNIILDKGLAYYVMDLNKTKELKITPHAAVEKINEFTRIEDFEIILALAEETPGIYRASIRSKKVNILPTTIKFGGGGHKKATGIKNLKLDKIEDLKKDLKELLNEK